MYDLRKANAWWAIGSLVLMLIGVCLMCTSCSLRAPAGPTPPIEHGLGATLVAIGGLCIWIGTIAVIACALARVAGFFPATAAIVAIASPFIGEVAALGIATAVLGGVVVWCGVHSWVLYVTVLGLAALYAFKHRSGVLAWLNAAKKV
jgi:hypothetical protein